MINITMMVHWNKEEDLPCEDSAYVQQFLVFIFMDKGFIWRVTPFIPVFLYTFLCILYPFIPFIRIYTSIKGGMLALLRLRCSHPKCVRLWHEYSVGWNLKSISSE